MPSTEIRNPNSEIRIPNSVHLREAFKFSLSLCLAYMIALSMDWSRPYWAGLAVTLCSLSTAGASLNKGIMRIVGCTFGCLVALMMVGLFAQEPWQLMLVFMPYIFFLTVMMIISPYAYAYKKTIIVSVLIVMGSYGNWDQTFSLAVQRTSETILGVVVYMLVSALLWPRYAGDLLKPHLEPVLDQLARLHVLWRQQYSGTGVKEEFGAARRAFLKSLPRAEETLAAAFGDSAAVRSHRRFWQHLRRDVRDFYDATILLHESCDSYRKVSIEQVFPDVHAALDRISARMARVSMLWQHYPDAPPEHGDDRELLERGSFDIQADLQSALSFEQRAALVTFIEQVRILDRTSRDLLAILRVLTGIEGRWRVNLHAFEAEPLRSPIWDPEVWLNAFRPVVVFVLVFLSWIYIEDLPDGPSTVTLTIVVVLFVITMMPADPIHFAKPFAIGLLLTAPAYFIVLPWLETPYGLFLFLFLFSFPWGYVGSRGDMFLKFFVVLTFLVSTGISNSQTFSFVHYADLSLVLLLTIVFSTAAFCLLPSSQPEKVFLRSLRTFFSSCARFVAVRTHGHGVGKNGFPKASFLRARVIGLPLRLRLPAAAINYKVVHGNTVEQVDGLLDSLQSVSFRLRALEDERDRAADHPGKLYETIRSMGISRRARLRELLEGWARLEDVTELREKRMRYRHELETIGNRLYEFAESPDLKDDQSLGILFSTQVTSAALMNALERLEAAVEGMDLKRWAFPRFSKP